MPNISAPTIVSNDQAVGRKRRRGHVIVYLLQEANRLRVAAFQNWVRTPSAFNLNDRLLSDVGFDKGHCQGKPSWHDQLEVERRRLR